MATLADGRLGDEVGCLPGSIQNGHAARVGNIGPLVRIQWLETTKYLNYG